MSIKINVTVWNEFIHEREDPKVAKIYPEGMHAVIARYLSSQGFNVRAAIFDEHEHGLTEEVLNNTD
ncbi:MAG: trehalose utilization protein ThuA, partial [Candidatus Bathyarchaeia archaeon]